MFNWVDIAVQRERYGDLAREAEHDWLVHQLSKCETSDHLYPRLLAWIGRVLIAAGKYLQERYGDTARISKPLASLGQ